MKAISLWQPWASLWVTQDAKIHETRSWPTKHRGPLAVHASKATHIPPWMLPLNVGDPLPEPGAAALRALGFEQPRALDAIRAYMLAIPRGCIVGVVVIEDCVPTTRGAATPKDEIFGDWSPGRFAFRRQAGPMPLSVPVPCRGFQGIWNLDPSIEAAVLAQMGERAPVSQPVQVQLP